MKSLGDVTTIYTDLYPRCPGRTHTQTECMTCARFDAAVDAYIQVRSKDELARFTWIVTPTETPCPQHQEILK